MTDELDDSPLSFFVCTEELDEGSDLWHCRNVILEQYVYDKARLERSIKPILSANTFWLDAN